LAIAGRETVVQNMDASYACENAIAGTMGIAGVGAGAMLPHTGRAPGSSSSVN